jgi:hypothetical protein
VYIRTHKDETGALTTFTAHVGQSGDLVFNEGTYYPGVGDCESRDVDEWVIVPAEKLPDLARTLECEADADTLVAAVVERCSLAGVKTLWDVEGWLSGLGVPFRRDAWYSI